MVCLLVANLEGSLLEGSFEVTGLTAEDDLMDVELMGSTDDLAVRKFFRVLSPFQSQLKSGCRCTQYIQECSLGKTASQHVEWGRSHIGVWLRLCQVR